VPPNFGRDIENGRGAEGQLLLDGSDSNTASIAMGYAEALVRAYAIGLQRQWQDHATGMSIQSGTTAPVVGVRVRVIYKSEMESRNYIVPGRIAVIVMIITAFLTWMTIAGEWEMGTMEQLLSSPVRPAEIVIGKMAAYFCVGVAATLISIVTGILVFHVPFRG